MTALIVPMVIASVLLAVPAGPGQGYANIIQRDTIHARGIEGTLFDGEGHAVEHARVEVFRCPARWPTGSMSGDVLRTGRTDAEGRFKIEDVNGDQLRCVRFSKSGFDPLIVRVKITTFASSKMRLRMQVAQ